MNREKKIHRVNVGAPQPAPVPRRGTLALRKSRLVRRRIRGFIYVIGFTLSLAAISHASYGFLMDAPYFQIKEIRIEGVSAPLQEEIKGLVKSMTNDYQNILGLDEEELRDQVARHPRIRDLRLDKVYPDQLLIRAVERQEVAIIATEKGMFLADDDRHVMEKLDPEDLATSELPFVSGLQSEVVHAGEPIKNASFDKAITLLQVLKERSPELYDKVSEIEIQTDEVSPLETLTAHMKGGMDIKFGDSNPTEKLPALETLLRKIEKDGIEPFEQLVFIDLTFDGMGVYMDRETALHLAMKSYDEFEQALEAETEKYQSAQEKTGKSGSQEKSASSASSRSRSGSSSQQSARKSSGQSASRATQQYPQQTRQGYGYQNYQQNAQQYYQQQYYQQQRGYAPAQQNYRPANQQRY